MVAMPAGAPQFPNLRAIELPSIRQVAPPAGADRLWCVVCERTFRPHQQRHVDDHLLCPYPDCDGGLMFEPWSWDWVREANPHYPREPLEDVAYPYFGFEAGAHREQG